MPENPPSISPNELHALRQEQRMKTLLLDMYEDRVATRQQFLDKALTACRAITDSPIGHLYFYEEKSKSLVLQSRSQEEYADCTAKPPPTRCHLDETGIWEEAVRQGKPILINAFQAHHPLKKGSPPGHVEPARYLAVPVLSNGRVVGVVGVANKATDYDQCDVQRLEHLMRTTWQVLDQRQRDEAMRISEQRYRRMVETAEEGIRILDTDGRTVYVNPRFAAMLGYAADDILGREAQEFIHPDEIPDYEQCKQRRKAGMSGQYERRMLHADGSTIWTRVSATPILDERNIYAGSFAMFSDITEIKRIERELRDNEARLQAITDNAQDAIVMMDHQGLISFWNPAAEVIFGYSADKAMGQNLHDLLAPQRYHPAHHCAFPRFLQCGQGQAVGKTLELEALHRGGQEISIELSLSSIYLQGHWHALGIVRDVSARKKAEQDLCEANNRLQDAMEQAKSMAHQAQAANDEKSRFLTTMSHEIRTPLNGVLGMAQLLQKTRLNDEQQRYVNVIRSSGDSLLNLINDILDFSKIEAGRLELVAEDFDPRQLVEEVGQMLALMVQERDISVTWESTPQTPRLVHGDMGRVRQILLNLGSNAVKFTDKGRIRLEVFPVSRHKEQVQLRFQVHDTGIGIADEKIPQLFETFFQVDTSITRKYGGTGLGLAISRRLAEMMGGEIGVESREKQGSMFWFTVNLRQAAHQVSATQTTPGTSGPVVSAQPDQECSPASPQCSSARVLLVEDNQVNQLVARRMLSKMGVEADIAHNGLEAVQATQRQRYDLILMDIEMPVMDGLEATQRIREAEAGEGHRTPIIVLTAHAIQGDRERFLAGGMDDYLTKPLNYAAFAKKISAWLTGKTYQTGNTDKA